MSKPAKAVTKLAKKIHMAVYSNGLRDVDPWQAVENVLIIIDEEKIKVANRYLKKMGLPIKVPEDERYKMPDLGRKVKYIPKKKYLDLDAPIKPKSKTKKSK